MYIPVFKFLPFTKSLLTKKTGCLYYLSLSSGFVTPSKITDGALNENYPKWGINTPLPILICLEMYKPNENVQIIFLFINLKPKAPQDLETVSSSSNPSIPFILMKISK